MSVAPEIFFNYYDDQEYFEYACRFVACYHEFPPGEPHTLTVIASGGLPGARWIEPKAQDHADIARWDQETR